MEAVLLLCVSLVQGAASTLKMIFNRKARDWHTDDTREALPHATSSISQTGTTLGPPGSRPAVDAQRRTRTLHEQTSTPILRDAHSVRPQDEVSGCKYKGQEVLILRDREAIVSKDEGGLTSLATRPSRHTQSLSSRKPQSGYPGPIEPQSESKNGSRLSLRSAGMTTASA
jgi:hypothetical protein